jgi:phosphatidylserine/phosphatidylglycerophosphate/cardiolipin synthase-like enzyme
LRLAGVQSIEAQRPGGIADPGLTAQIITESKIRDQVANSIDAATRGDRIMLAMFYLSHREIITALKSAQRRGAEVRILLDPNRDAFGRVKSGIPNRPVAHELNACGIPVRWCDTHGEQCHSKMLLVDYHNASSVLILGSANFTRRNLDDFNLESDVALRGPRHAPPFDAARAFFEAAWGNESNRSFSVDYARYADASIFKRVLYRAMEASGISTF